ncbi:hypothetical protein ACGFNU_35075 [Spirillospora sp. NPDC048911]|uniref:hypothetical protein n=1 Tax=Spirillospora sp. NPDC048911 TaxID=3364527 RepID=UPI003714C43D
MSVLSDYFSAPSDEEAAHAITESLSSLFDDVLQMNNLFPDYHLVPLEAFLTGRSTEEIEKGPRHGKLLASVDDHQVMVVTVSDELMVSLAAASPQRLVEAAESWSRFEDFQGSDTSGLVDFLRELADLARRAMTDEEHLYCKMSC